MVQVPGAVDGTGGSAAGNNNVTPGGVPPSMVDMASLEALLERKIGTAIDAAVDKVSQTTGQLIADHQKDTRAMISSALSGVQKEFAANTELKADSLKRKVDAAWEKRATIPETASQPRDRQLQSELGKVGAAFDLQLQQMRALLEELDARVEAEEARQLAGAAGGAGAAAAGDSAALVLDSKALDRFDELLESLEKGCLNKVRLLLRKQQVRTIFGWQAAEAYQAAMGQMIEAAEARGDQFEWPPPEQAVILEADIARQVTAARASPAWQSSESAAAAMAPTTVGDGGQQHQGGSVAMVAAATAVAKKGKAKADGASDAADDTGGTDAMAALAAQQAAAQKGAAASARPSRKDARKAAAAAGGAGKAGKAAAGPSAGSPAATGGGDSRGAKRRRKQAATKAAGS